MNRCLDEKPATGNGKRGLKSFDTIKSSKPYIHACMCISIISWDPSIHWHMYSEMVVGGFYFLGQLGGGYGRSSQPTNQVLVKVKTSVEDSGEE